MDIDRDAQHLALHPSVEALSETIIETAWVILNCAGGWLGYSTLSMTADVSTAPKPDQ
jgi:hypothetical protein